MDTGCLQENIVPYGRTYWSPDGEMFLFLGPQNGCSLPLALLGKTDGGALWDLTGVLGLGADIRWGE